MNRFVLGAVFACSTAAAFGQTGVGSVPKPEAKDQSFHDKRYGVSFKIPAGWDFRTKDGQISTFHLDAHSSGPKSEMRAVAAMDFNPYPLSTFSGGVLYESAQKHISESDCAVQAGAPATPRIKAVGGMEFRHGHDETWNVCVEARDEVYTAYRKGVCYRFDLVVNTFCAISSGAQELSERQYNRLEQGLEEILATVRFDWKPVPLGPEPPAVPANPERKPLPPAKPKSPPIPSGRS